jgi:pyruvate kinase
MIRTKIVATVGPASSDAAVLRRLAEARADVFRVNFSHGGDQQRQRLLEGIRSVEAALDRPLAVMADLCGPKIRVGMIRGGSFLLGDGHEIVVQRDPIEGTPQRISTTLAELVDQVRAGETILLDDGMIRLEVTETRPPRELVCRVVRGGVLSSGKGVNLPRIDLNLGALTEKDRNDIEWIARRDFDYVALSFVRGARDVQGLRELLERAQCRAGVIAKIEKPQALERIREIVAAADAIMVARGDLGAEMDLAAVPVAQKRIAKLCQQAGKPCIIATQMLESMTNSPVPTRAEVSDVANAVLDQADAVMLSGETAVGKFPVESVRMMNEIVSRIQAYHDETAAPARVEYASAPTEASIASAVRAIMNEEEIAAVAVYTATGATALLMAKNRLRCPILALSHERATMRRTCLYYGVVAFQAEMPEHTREVLDLAARFAIQAGLARSGQKIIVISGRPIGVPGHTNTLVVHTIP